MENLMGRILQGDKRSAAKAISIIENNQLSNKNELLDLLYNHTGKAKVIGITGPPGAGKSTLVDGLIKVFRSQGFTVGVIAIDPSSPFTGGAILGDRIRMQNHATDSGVFIRSMGSRGTLGGLARATKESIKVLDALGMDVIIIETVGVGQSELEIMNIADSTVVVLHPSAGDSIQAFKAGIMEIADLFVINKSDLPGTQKLFYELEMLIQMTKQNAEWKPPIIKTISTEKHGIDLLSKVIEQHLTYLEQHGHLQNKRNEHLKIELTEMVHALVEQQISEYMNGEDYLQLLERLQTKQLSPVRAATEIMKKI